MSTGTIGFGGNADMMRLLQQNLFKQIDSNADGAVDKAELESAVTEAGGTVEEADALFETLDSAGAGSINSEQFVGGLKPNRLGDGMMAHLIGLQEAPGGGGETPRDPLSVASDLFAAIDSDGDGSITQSELEEAVVSAGGSSADADALYAKLDPDGTGSVTEEEFAQAIMPPPPSPFSASTGETDESSEASAVAATESTATDSSTGSASTALQLLLDALNSSDGTQDEAAAETGDASAAFRDLVNSLESSGSASASSGLAASAVQDLLDHYLQTLTSTTASAASSVSTTA